MSVKRLVCAIGVSVVVILGLYAVNIARTSTSNLPNKENTALRIISNEEYAPGMDISAANCPRTIPKTSTPGKPVWVAGYPGSGFDIVAPLSSAVSGLTAVDIYRQHTCLKPVQGTDIPISACMTHWPLVAKDSPAQVAMNDGILYQHQAVFLIRNPAQAIPSYHTRWWGAQKHIRANHEQPDEAEWLTWRDQRFDHHLHQWKKAATEWQRGIPAAGVTGIGLYVPFEQLVAEDTGPALMASFANHLEHANHEVAAHTSCLWKRIVQAEEARQPKRYRHSFTRAQQQAMLTMLDEMVAIYSVSEPRLERILMGYRHDIESNLRLDGD